MPHYKDGTPATVGDTVRGKGYNIKDPATGELAEITGTLLHIDANSETCNVQVGVVEIETLPEDREHAIIRVAGLVQWGAKFLPVEKLAHLRIEYGQADHFEKV